MKQILFSHFSYGKVRNRAVASSIIGGGGADFHIFVFTNHKNI